MPKLTPFFVTPELQQILDNLPADEPRSKLEPFRPFILRWRREGRSYRRIREILADKCSVQVSTEGLRKFVQRRSRPRKGQPDAEPLPVRVTAPEPPIADQSTTFTRQLRRTPEEIAAMREAASAANHKPVFPIGETKPLFHYDPSRPLSNKPTEED